jgi:hypothetical protein
MVKIFTCSHTNSNIIDYICKEDKIATFSNSKNKKIENFSNSEIKKIAFLFLIRESINQEELWNLFFKDVDPKLYNIYIHYKNNKPLLYFDKYKLSNCVDTKYADISLVKAQNILLKKALEDKDNQHFIFVSESCIPLKSFNYIYGELNPSFSYFNMFSKDDCFPRCFVLLPFVTFKHIQKASQWCILNRKHSELMISNEKNLSNFSNIYAPDEHCYIIFIYQAGLENEIITTEYIADGATTFTNWSNMKYKYNYSTINHKIYSPELKNYNSISTEELVYLIKSKSLFGRKFTSKCNLSNYIYKETIKS